MKFVELTVTTTVEAEELIADVFWEYTDYGVAISSVFDAVMLLKSDVIYDYYDDKIVEGIKDISLVKGFFPIENAQNLMRLVRVRIDALKENSPFNLGTLEMVTREVDGDDWLSIWKKHFKPINFGKVTICPEWIDYNGDEIIVKIDSNMAFGTGEHETTSMVVNSMQEFIFNGTKVLDVGTGSGILGITASKMGAELVVMTEIDPVAVEVAKRNTKLNGVQDKCQVLCQGDLSKIDEKFDLCVANITAEVLVILAQSMCNLVSEGGHLVLSGVLNDRVKKVTDCFIRFGAKTIKTNSIGEWSSLVLKKL